MPSIFECEQGRKCDADRATIDGRVFETCSNYCACDTFADVSAKSKPGDDEPPRSALSELDSYEKKRNPGATSEPFSPTRGVAAHARNPKHETQRGEFVIHMHDATRLHYDVRIEIGGVLKSFVVPKGPSLDPKEKRLAIEVENHPLPYLDFEAVIPPGNYGAGSMIVWDRGVVRYRETSAEEGHRIGKIDFDLWGRKVKGHHAFVNTSRRKNDGEEDPKEKPQWLLIKKADEYAKPDCDPNDDLPTKMPGSILSGLTVEELSKSAAIAEEISSFAQVQGARKRASDSASSFAEPMRCATEGAPLDDPDWLYELKVDGVRILATKDGDDVTLHYRTGRSATASYPEVARAIRALPIHRVVLDGEIVAFDATGRTNFHKLAKRIQATRPSDIRYAALETPVTFLAFDCLELGSRASGALDLRPVALEKRKAVLARVLPRPGVLRVLDHIAEKGSVLFAFCEQQGLEGIVAKKLGTDYRHGPTRSDTWVKVKTKNEDDFVVVGYTVGKGARKRLGAVDIASYEGDELVYRGKVGGGLSDAQIDALLKTLPTLHCDAAPASGEWMPAPEGREYVRPDIVVRVRYPRWTDGGHLWQPTFVGIRKDARPRDCDATPNDRELLTLESVAQKKRVREDERTVGRHRFTLSNQNKVFWPDAGLTKGDLCDYYESIAEFILPHLRDRPIVLVRFPNGIEGKSFYQWNAPEGTPSWVRTHAIREGVEGKRDVETFIVDDVDMLLHLANLGVIPIHALGYRVGAGHQGHEPEAAEKRHCDFLTIDFDVEDATLRDGITLARGLKALLDEVGLAGFAKTSGKTGLHVMVPLGPGVTFETATGLCQVLGKILETRFSEIGTTERMKDKRGAKVYIDTGQTGRARTIVAPYSVRAHPGGTVSAPLFWEEVGFALDPRHFDMQSVPERARTYGDPMAELLTVEVDLPSAVTKLGKLLGR